jgi:hypothetical protein
VTESCETHSDMVFKGMEDFKVARYRFIIEALEQLSLPPYKGSTFRGGFGSAFRSIACSDRRAECGSCLLSGTCPYAYVFETAPPEGSQALSKFERVPHPFVLEPPLTRQQQFSPGDVLPVGVVLTGRGIDFLPYFIVAFQEFGRMGIGRGRGRFRLKSVYAVTGTDSGGSSLPGPLSHDAEELNLLDCNDQGPLVFDGDTNKVYTRDIIVKWQDFLESSCMMLENQKSGASRATVFFDTMTRLKFAGSLEDRPEFHIIIRSLLRRASSLLYFHHGTTLDMDFSGFISKAGAVRLASYDTKWVDWERYSSRQDARMKLGGIVGSATYEFPEVELARMFLPWLLLAEYVHIGKGATFGLGEIRAQIAG